MRAEDPRLIEARARPISEIVDLLQIDGLRRAGAELTGPCPDCGGHDRFSVNTRKGVFGCRRCGARGDGIAMIRWLMHFTLPEALTWLCGDRPAELSPEDLARRRSRAAKAMAKADDDAARYRRRAENEARGLWNAGLPAEGSPVRAYLAARGLTKDLLPVIPDCLRHHPDLPYMAQDASASSAGRVWTEIHRGPAMLAAVQRPSGSVMGVHRTWIDVDRPRGKARIELAGQPQPVKKTWGSIKGGAIRLHTPSGDWDTLVMGEGIETTLTALVSGRYPGAAFWAGVSLGNIAGRRRSGPGLKFAGLPDMQDAAAFVPPLWVRQLVLIEDGDSEPKFTRASMLSGARRAMACIPGLSARIVPCPDGEDLNDVLLEDDP